MSTNDWRMRWTHLPAGFTRTPSKLEIKLIKLVFTPEEALVAGHVEPQARDRCRDRGAGRPS